jgi:glycosyltransferase involved in cell wall biosynthesis
MNEPDVLKPLVSVIVTTRNEERNIGNCLQSIQLQTYRPIEIIVVDNYSTDRTQEIARSFTDVVVNKGPERSAQRNHGICDLAIGQYAMFIDADMILSPTLIAECLTEIQIDGAVALHIEEVILGRGILAKIRRFERSFYSGTVIDGARFFERSIFCSIGGFDPELPPGPEDWDLDKRLKSRGRIVLLNSKSNVEKWPLQKFILDRGIEQVLDYVGVYHNESELGVKKYLTKKKYYSPSMSAYVAKWSAGDMDIKKQLGISYRYLTVFLEDKKWKKLFRHPVLALGMFVLRVLVGVNYLAVRSIASKLESPTIA